MKSVEFKTQIANFQYSEILKFIESQSFPVGWKETNFLKELRKKNSVYFIAYDIPDKIRNFHEHKKVLLNNKIIVGYAGVWFHKEFSEIVSVAVLQNFRRLGVGNLLINELIDYVNSNKKVKMINLEVGKKNFKARSLYKQLGFKENGYRRKYYLHDGDDAILMSLKINY
tara:strand:+ start:3416 stop:3925 length:510 start_codon:yes stop_codon:yes gene_type:complete